MSKYYSYMFYADRNVRPCTILGYTLTTFPKSLMQIETTKITSTKLRAVKEGPCTSKKGLAAQFHWFKGSTLVNINGGHSEGYIRNASLGSVPKIANLPIFFSFILIRLDNHIFQGSFHHSL